MLILITYYNEKKEKARGESLELYAARTDQKQDYCELFRMIDGEIEKYMTAFGKENFKTCMGNIAQEKMYFKKLHKMIKKSSIPTLGEQDILRIFRFFQWRATIDSIKPFEYKIKMGEEKSVDVGWVEARRIITCHIHFKDLITYDRISCEVDRAGASQLPWYHLRYIEQKNFCVISDHDSFFFETLNNARYGVYGPYFQEKYKRAVRLFEWYNLDRDPRTRGLKKQVKVMEALEKRPASVPILFTPFKRLLRDIV